MASLQTAAGVDIGGVTGIDGTSLRVNTDQVKASYRASTVGVVTLANGTGPFFSLYGSATKVIRVTRLYFAATIATAAANVILLLSKRSTAPTGGTPSAMTATKMDENDAAPTATVTAYTAAPTAGTLLGTLDSRRDLLNVTGAVATVDEFFDFGQYAAKPIVLRGVAQGIDLSFQTAPGNAVAGILWVEWTEE